MLPRTSRRDRLRAREAVVVFGEEQTAELLDLLGGYCLMSVKLDAYDMFVRGGEEGLPETSRHFEGRRTPSSVAVPRESIVLGQTEASRTLD